MVQQEAQTKTSNEDKLREAIGGMVSEAIATGHFGKRDVPVHVRITVGPTEFKAALDLLGDLDQAADETVDKINKVIDRCQRLLVLTQEIRPELDKGP